MVWIQSHIFRAPKSKHTIGCLAFIALILNKQAPKHSIGDLFNKGGPTEVTKGKTHEASVNLS